MTDTGIKEQILCEISELAKKYDVKKVVLFGSRARGDYLKKVIYYKISKEKGLAHFFNIREKSSVKSHLSETVCVSAVLRFL